MISRTTGESPRGVLRHGDSNRMKARIAQDTRRKGRMLAERGRPGARAASQRLDRRATQELFAVPVNAVIHFCCCHFI
jgi:hypothetical protein